MRTHRQSGWWLMAIGAIHCLIGVLMSWEIFSLWHQSGWWHSVEQGGALHMDRFAALWFQVAGLSWLAMGWLMQLWLQRLGPLPAPLGWSLMFMGALVAYVLPVSGAWLLLALGGQLVWAARTPSSAGVPR